MLALSPAHCSEGGQTIECLHSSIIYRPSGKGDIMIAKCLDSDSAYDYRAFANLLSSELSPDGQILLQVKLYDLHCGC